MSDTLPVVQIVTQKAAGDCGIVVLAMYLGKSYEDVFAATVQETNAHIHNDGMWVTQIKRVAKALGVTLRRQKAWNMDEDAGMLILDGSRRTDGMHHVVLLKAGLIFNTDGLVWEPDVFLKHFRYRPTGLLVRA